VSLSFRPAVLRRRLACVDLGCSFPSTDRLGAGSFLHNERLDNGHGADLTKANANTITVLPKKYDPGLCERLVDRLDIGTAGDWKTIIVFHAFDRRFGDASLFAQLNWYNVLGFDKITPLAQIIGSHRGHDRGEAADPFNTGFDRLMFSPGIEFTKVLDEPNNRVLKVYFDVEIPFYYRVKASVNDAGSEGQLIAPVLYKLVTSYNF